MTRMLTAVLGPLLLLSLYQGAQAAEDHSTTFIPTIAQMPLICATAAAIQKTSVDMGHDMKQANTDLMAGMNENNQLMMQAGMVNDPDVAFICAMIPHHQSAINMAKAELKHGSNKWAKQTAQKIIDAQEAEIGEMLTWLGGEGLEE